MNTLDAARRAADHLAKQTKKPCPACKGEGHMVKPYIAGVVNVCHPCGVCDGRGCVTPEQAKNGRKQ